MRIFVLNPNSSQQMTASIWAQVERIRRTGTEVQVERVSDAPPSISSVEDEARATPGVVRQVLQAAKAGFDAAIIACFSDPGLVEARKAVSIPVLGIQATTLCVAVMLGKRFTILTPLARRVPDKERDVEEMGLKYLLASVRPLDLSVEETDSDPERTKTKAIQVARKALEEDAAEAVILGCAGMAGYAEHIQQVLGVLVLDPITVTFKVCEGLGEAVFSSSRAAATGPRGRYGVPRGGDRTD